MPRHAGHHPAVDAAVDVQTAAGVQLADAVFVILKIGKGIRSFQPHPGNQFHIGPQFQTAAVGAGGIAEKDIAEQFKRNDLIIDHTVEEGSFEIDIIKEGGAAVEQVAFDPELKITRFLGLKIGIDQDVRGTAGGKIIQLVSGRALETASKGGVNGYGGHQLVIQGRLGSKGLEAPPGILHREDLILLVEDHLVIAAGQ